MSPQESPAYIAGLRKRMLAIRDNSRDSHDEPTKEQLAASLEAHSKDSKDAPIERPDSLEPDDAEPSVDGEDKREDASVQASKQEERGGRHIYGPELNPQQFEKDKAEEGAATDNGGPKYAAVGRRRGKEIQKALRELEPESSVREEKIPAPPPTRSTPSLLRSTIERSANNSGSFESNPYPEDAPQWPRNTGKYSAASPVQPLSRRHLTPLTSSSYSSNFSVFPAGRAISPVTPFRETQHRLTPTIRVIRESGPEPPSVEWFNRNVAFGSDHPYFGMTPQQRRQYWENLPSYHTSSRGSRSPSENTSLHPPRQRHTSSNERQVAQSPSRPLDQHRNQQAHHESTSQAHAAPNSHRDLEASYWNNLSPEARRLAREHRSSTPPAATRPTREKSPSPATTQPGTDEKRKSTTGLLIKKLTCRPGAATPVYTTTAPATSASTSTPFTAAAPTLQKHGLSYLRRKIQRGVQKGHQQAEDPQLDTSSPGDTTVTTTTTRSHNKRPTAPLDFPPVRLSSMIQRAPASIRSTQNLHALTPRDTGVRTTSLLYRRHPIDDDGVIGARVAALRLQDIAASAVRERDEADMGLRRERYPPRHTDALLLPRHPRFAHATPRARPDIPRLASPLERVPDMQTPRYPHYRYNYISRVSTGVPRRVRTVSQPKKAEGGGRGGG